MPDDQLMRNFALEQAVTANPNADERAIVRAAEAFLAFLKGGSPD